jgi:hypothetical protein
MTLEQQLAAQPLPASYKLARGPDDWCWELLRGRELVNAVVFHGPSPTAAEVIAWAQASIVTL